MDTKYKKYNIVSYVLTSLTILFFIGVLLFGISSLFTIFQNKEENNIGTGLTTVFLVFFFLICLVPTICFSLGSIVFCISPLKNKYHTKANIAKIIINILVLISCITLLLIFKFKE